MQNFLNLQCGHNDILYPHVTFLKFFYNFVLKIYTNVNN
jgi:hypothetical protein